MSRWFPKPGDLVIIPATKPTREKRLTKRVDYGLILQQTEKCNFKGAWWDVLQTGEVVTIHVQDISPLWDKEGLCLQEISR